MLQLGQAEPLRLQRVVAVRQARIGRLHGGDEGIHHLILHHVGAVARAGGARVAPPAVLDLLVLRQHVGDQGEQPRLLGQSGGDARRRSSTPRPILVGQAVESIRHRQPLLADGDAHGGDRLCRTGAPRRPAPLPTSRAAASPPPPTAGAGGRRASRAARASSAPAPGFRHSGGAAAGILEAVKLEGEEQQVGGDRRHPLCHRLLEAAVGGVLGIGGEDEAGVGHHPPEDLLDRLVFWRWRRPAHPLPGWPAGRQSATRRPWRAPPPPQGRRPGGDRPARHTDRTGPTPAGIRRWRQRRVRYREGEGRADGGHGRPCTALRWPSI